ncbi:MAG: RNA 3'-terminal phosphate cyclase [Thaumarchaeota archaeon]|nr:RNA 3'-terminal phosphate cyclase [Nitrososphaerota archaeon]
MDPVEVDGSQGEGGGQILRTAVAFSAIRRAPVRIVKIRAGRDVPGLKRQHVSALKVLASVFGGELDGAEEGSSTVRFVPGRPRLSSFSIDMGTAASITLVLQAVVPAVSLSGSSLELSLTGGTDVPWSPTADYFREVVVPGYGAVGIRADVGILRRGYYPRGGGVVRASIHECRALTPLRPTHCPPVAAAEVTSRCGALPRKVAERQAQAAVEVLSGSAIRAASVRVTEEQASSPGTSVLVSNVGNGCFIGSDAIGARGKQAEAVGKEAAERFVSAAASNPSMDSNLADMVIPLLSLAPGPSEVRVPAVTPHLESGLRLASQFTSCSWSVRQEGKGAVVAVVPANP